MFNPYSVFKSLLPDNSVAVAEILSISNGVATVELFGGQTVQVRGQGTVGQKVFIRDGLIEAPAPTLTVVSVTV